MIPTSDGGIIVTSEGSNALTAGIDIEVIKFNSAADIEWVGLYGGSETDIG